MSRNKTLYSISCSLLDRIRYFYSVDLKNLIQTMKDLKSNRMLEVMERQGLSDKLTKENLTVFSLIDEALIEYEDDHNKIENEVEPEFDENPPAVRRRRQTNMMSDLILMHIIPGFVKSGDFDDEQLLPSLNPSAPDIRINIYNNPKRVVTANCAPIISANNYATNGIVHIIDRVMQKPTKTIGQMIETDPKFTILSNLIRNTDLMSKLKDNKSHITFFAPTNDAFKRLEKSHLDRLLSGEACVGSLLNNHIIPNTLCLSAIHDFASVKNVLNLLLPIKRVNEKLEIDGIPIVESDYLGTNGVIHMIDGVIISEKSEPISKFLRRHQMTQYLDLIKESGLLSQWDSLQNVSFFVPSIDSLRSLSAQKLEQIKNNSKAMISYHVVRPKSDSCDLVNDQMLDSLTTNQLRINLFQDIPGFGFKSVATAQCAKIVGHTRDICDANIHIVDRFLMPAKGDVSQVLESKGNFSKILSILRTSGIESELQNGTYTLLAPNDNTFSHHFNAKELNSLINNSTESEKFIRFHLLPEIICCSGVGNSPLFIGSQQIRNLEGSLISVHKTLNGRVRFGNARADECDLMATNGVIHVINKVLDKRPSIGSGFPFPMFEMIF